MEAAAIHVFVFVILLLSWGLQARQLTSDVSESGRRGPGKGRVCEADSKLRPGKDCNWTKERCDCPDGYKYDDKMKCYREQPCRYGEPPCTCEPGYSQKGKECNKEVECEVPSPKCQCHHGYHPVDDECRQEEDCHHWEEAQCRCPAGYTLKDGKCYGEPQTCKMYIADKPTAHGKSGGIGKEDGDVVPARGPGMGYGGGPDAGMPPDDRQDKGSVVKDECHCPKDQVLEDSKCYPVRDCIEVPRRCECKPPHREQDGKCVKTEACSYGPKTCHCPSGDELKDGECRKEEECHHMPEPQCQCLEGYDHVNGTCYGQPKACQDDGMGYKDGGTGKDLGGWDGYGQGNTTQQCRCPAEHVYKEGRCHPVRPCSHVPGRCQCKESYQEENGKCVKKDKCTPTPQDCKCPSGYQQQGDKCTQTKQCTLGQPKCECDQGYTAHDKKCVQSQECHHVPQECLCPSGHLQQGDKCYPNCDEGYNDQGVSGGHRLCVASCPSGYQGYCKYSQVYFCNAGGKCPPKVHSVSKCGY